MRIAKNGDVHVSAPIGLPKKTVEKFIAEHLDWIEQARKRTLQRQQQIMTRLLEHERAEMQREREERRESREAGDLYSQPSPAELERYNRTLQPTADPLRTLPPTLSPYYRQKVNDYFYR